MVNMINVNMTSWSTCVGSTRQRAQDEHVKGQHDKEHQDEQVHPQVTIAVPDAGEENSSQAHHHLIGEKPRWPILLTLFNFEESTLWSSESKLMTLLVFQGPPAQAAVEKEQGSSQIPGLTIYPHPHYHQIFRFLSNTRSHYSSSSSLNHQIFRFHSNTRSHNQ